MAYLIVAIGPTNDVDHKKMSGVELLQTLGSLAPHSPKDFSIDLNGVFRIPFPNKNLGAWMANRRNRQLLGAIKTARAEISVHSPNCSDLLGDCASVEDASANFLDGTFFQVSVRQEPLVLQRDSHGVVFPFFSTPVQAISFLKDVVGDGAQEENRVPVDDVSIQTVSGAKVSLLYSRVAVLDAIRSLRMFSCRLWNN